MKGRDKGKRKGRQGMTDMKENRIRRVIEAKRESRVEG